MSGLFSSLMPVSGSSSTPLMPEPPGRPGPEGPGFGGGPGGPRGPGRPGGSGIKGVELDPLTGINDENKPLISKLLAVPALRTRYLGYMRDIAEKWLDWKKLGPVVEQYRSLIEEE